jgi:putative nucleotidyltransferase with HDIG domain
MGQNATPTKEKAAVLYQCATGIAEGVFKNPTSSEALVRSKKVVSHTMDLLAKDSSAFLEMISLSSHDYYTYTHCVNVMTFTISLLSSLGHGKDRKILEEAAIGAFLHDIGKAKVPLEVLNKPGPLTADEWKIMKKHPEYGMDLLGNKTVPPRSKDIILQHHEKINGIGYPYGLKGDQIPIVSQVVSLCDAYDAMTTNRCYSKARTPFEAFKIITQDMKGHFTGELVASFIQLLNLDKKR